MSGLFGRSYDQPIGSGSSKACRKQGCPNDEQTRRLAAILEVDVVGYSRLLAIANEVIE
jgi:hypothetical protein